MNDLKRKHIYLDSNKVKEMSEKYEYLKDFKKENPTYYAFVKRHKKWDLISNLKRLK